MSLPRTVSFAAVVTLVLLLGGPAARADVAPPNACNTAGQACNTAPTPNGAYTGEGTCVATMCAHTTPLADGGLSTTQVPCTLCEASDAGASGSKGGSGGGGGGCSIGRFSALDLAPLGLVAAGAALLAASRRRRTRS